ncbi:tRNA pseudouridine(38-40) synthase TruA [Fictibacillus phosphorivorans]|uniref:tRNA pseudouridine(38-40) synthase TruA n=1 Tax=Fictibacillus phosphorivorans TaxID=1221500 RepID=UPI002041D6CB|nr:tRNA pseudouridine(38-40) synthase TruA [Fictibacillus phosphorivorans]MCM3719785.1 tRNA pseudouridine(38-40) synthase TruA [Fictibacillus phosphorivorans]MCM3777417.1 tRNA pseudouridine(38-40) synthase TruA [Fictibacillus phosphorivorans]
MARMKVTVAYDGTDFAGYQIQPSGRTVQGTIQSVLQKMHKGEAVQISASGRTDAGVHAVGQVFHFDTEMNIPGDAWVKALNAMLPNDIVIKRVEEVTNSFHSRFSAESKEYHYKLLVRKQPDVFRRNHLYHYPYPLNIQAMQSACVSFIGTHDFTSFSSARSEVADKVRTIYSLELLEEDEVLTFKIKGSGFLYNMVRIIVGTLLEVGQGKRTPDEISGMIAAKDRALAGKTAPAHGLYLHQVNYQENPE